MVGGWGMSAPGCEKRYMGPNFSWSRKNRDQRGNKALPAWAPASPPMWGQLPPPSSGNAACTPLPGKLPGRRGAEISARREGRGSTTMSLLPSSSSPAAALGCAGPSPSAPGTRSAFSFYIAAVLISTGDARQQAICLCAFW